MLAKSLTFLAGATAAGIVLGARVPIILTSRADSLDNADRVLCRGRPRCRRRRRDAVFAAAIELLGAATDCFHCGERGFVQHQIRAARVGATVRHAAARFVRRDRHHAASASARCLRRDDGGASHWPAEGFDHAAATREMMALGPEVMTGMRPTAVGHRVVHGGMEFSGPVVVQPDVMARLEALCPLAPLHQPANLAVIRAIGELGRDVPQVACFDTAFHRSQPDITQSFALPRELTESGIRRYGFHGLSYEYIASRLPDLDPALFEQRAGRGASRQWRESFVPCGEGEASPARWASPPWTD